MKAKPWSKPKAVSCLRAEDAEEEAVCDDFGVLALHREPPELPANRVRDQPAEADQEEALEGHGESVVVCSVRLTAGGQALIDFAA